MHPRRKHTEENLGAHQVGLIPDLCAIRASLLMPFNEVLCSPTQLIQQRNSLLEKNQLLSQQLKAKDDILLSKEAEIDALKANAKLTSIALEEAKQGKNVMHEQLLEKTAQHNSLEQHWLQRVTPLFDWMFETEAGMST